MKKPTQKDIVRLFSKKSALPTWKFELIYRVAKPIVMIALFFATIGTASIILIGKFFK